MKQKKDIIACSLAAFCVVAGAAYVGLCRAPVECATESMTAIPVALDSHRDTFGEQPLRVSGAKAIVEPNGVQPDAPGVRTLWLGGLPVRWGGLRYSTIGHSVFTSEMPDKPLHAANHGIHPKQFGGTVANAGHRFTPDE